jgi:hypothetical protein
MRRGVIISILFVLACLKLSAQYDTSLIAWWHFDDGTAKDHSGNGYNGLLVNNPKLIPGVDDKGFAFEFKGSGVNTDEGSHIILPMIDFKKYNEFTITLWVKYYGLTHNGGEAFIWFGDHDRGWLGLINHVRYPYYDGILYLQFAVGAKLDYSISPINILFDSKFVNEWVHYAMVYKNGTLKAYINGKKIDSISQSVNVVGSNAGLARHWWGNGGGTSTRFNGAIDDVKIYKRALNDDEIVEKCDETAFEFKKFESNSNIILNGNSSIIDSTIVLTDSQKWKNGSSWYKFKVPVKKGFQTEFSFRLSNGEDKYVYEKYPGADGICFVIQNHSSKALGSVGGGIGFKNIPNSFVVEFDTYKNTDDNSENYNDPNENHIGIFCKGIYPNNCDHNDKSCLATLDSIIPIIPDGRVYYAKIEYNPKKELLVYFDTLIISNQSPILFLKDIDISSMLNLELGEYSWVGFTSSTGNAHEKHEILNWNFCPNPSDVILSTEDNEINSEELLVIPNPISNFATFKFNNSDNELIELKIFNMLGCEIKTLRERNNIIIWNCSDSNGIKVLNGLYFFTIKIGNHIKSGKIIVE